jgi:hypothetical protein
MSVKCRHCDARIVIRALTTGRRLPFDAAMIAADSAPGQHLYVPQQRGGAVVMVAAADISAARLAGVRWFATMHSCTAGLYAWHERREHIDGLQPGFVDALLKIDPDLDPDGHSR